ncbi:MAG TPA: hypothetical protein VGM39_24470 [Kofleriaceae bacterium]|jgi:hypothetical protein
MESFVDLSYRGLSLGRRVKLTQVRPTTGYLETPAPMPVGTSIAIATDEGHAIEAIVTSIHEQVGGLEQAPGMTVTPKLAGALADWWKERVQLPEAPPAPPPAEPPPPLPVAVAPAAPVVPAEPPTRKPADTVVEGDSMLAALAAASQTVTTGGGDQGRTIAMPAMMDPDALQNDGRTMAMPAMTDPDATDATRLDAPIVPAAPILPSDSARISQPLHAVVDDGKSTMLMDAVDPAALGLDTGDSQPTETDDEPDPRKSSPNLPASVKKRRKKNR